MQPILPTNGALEEHVRRAALPAGHVRGQVLVSIPSYYLCHVNRAGRRHQRDTMNLLDVPPRYRQAASYPTAVRWGFFAAQVQKKAAWECPAICYCEGKSEWTSSWLHSWGLATVLPRDLAGVLAPRRQGGKPHCATQTQCFSIKLFQFSFWPWTDRSSSLRVWKQSWQHKSGTRTPIGTKNKQKNN